jgi:septal ring factor EnvC (AmiA/AmiB activator)
MLQALSDDILRQLEKDKAVAIAEKNRIAADLERIHEDQIDLESHNESISVAAMRHKEIRRTNTELQDHVAGLEREHADRVDELEDVLRNTMYAYRSPSPPRTHFFAPG